MQVHDVIVVGGGGAGLRAAVAAHEAGADVAVVTKLHPVRSHTGAAEGGINASIRTPDTVDDHAHDTMKGSDYLGDAPAIERLCETSPQEVTRLEHMGMLFSRDEDGRMAVRYLAGHANPRTTYAGTETGHHLLHTLYEQVVKRGITVYDERYVTRLAVTDHDDPADRSCHGVVALDVRSGEVVGFHARRGVILATGGLGQVYDHTTNAVANTGDGAAMAYRAGVPLQDMEFVQFHPTTLPSTGVLISEGVRGEGGILYNCHGERFMFERGYATATGELASRDVVSRAELQEVQAGRGIRDEFVYLDMRHLGSGRIRDRLESILHLARDFEGVDPLEEPMPVKPGQHFAMGGIETDEHGSTCIDGLYAAGECACVSVHGSNRLGGNALPELIVFGARAGRHAAGRDLGRASVGTGREASVGDAVEPSRPNGSGHRPAQREGAGDGSGGPAGTVGDAVDCERVRIDELLERDGRSHAPIRAELQSVMDEHVNVFRDADGLEAAIRRLGSLRERYASVSVADPSRTFNTDLVHTIETGNLLDVAEAISLGALNRTESRGAHWRTDFPDRDDDEWIKHTMLAQTDGRTELYYKPVLLEGASGRYEPTERSY